MTAWTGRARAGSMLLVSIVIVLVVSLAVAVVGAPVPGIALLVIVVAVVLVAFLTVVVTVDERGLTVRSGNLPFARVHFPVERIIAVEAIDVNPWKWGGWGYRGSVRFFRRGAWVLRGGPGIKVDLVDGRVFVVTVDDADAGAAALHGLLTSTPR